MLALLIAVLLFLVQIVRSELLKPGNPYRRAPASTDRRFASRRKPEWVRNEVMRLKAYLRESGTCRAIAALFNRRFARKKRITVGRTFVSEVIRAHRYEITVLRRRMKNRKPRPVARNAVWAVDLTGKATLDGPTRLILGILEHSSRAALWLEALESKSSWRLVHRLAQAVRRYGKPRSVRTDNEAVFTSAVFRLALLVLGIRHQRSEPGCPWQNGRIERFFGTLKQKLDQLAVDSLQGLNLALGEFRFFYNHVRSHQNLDGATPAEAWGGIAPFTDRFKSEHWFEAWDGLLKGYYLRR